MSRAIGDRERKIASVTIMVPALQNEDMGADATPFADETRAWLDAALIDIGGNLAAMIQFALEALEFAGHRLSQTAVNPLLQSPGDPSGKEVGRKRRRGSPLHGHTPTEDVEFGPTTSASIPGLATVGS